MTQHIDKALPPGTPVGLGVLGPLRPFLAFLRRHLALLLLWPAIALGAAALLWGGVLLDLRHELHDRKAELEQQVDAYTRSLVIRTRRSIGDTDRLLQLLRHNWSASGQRIDLAGTIEAGIFSQQHIAAVAIIGRNGMVLTSSHPSAVGQDFSDKAYFIAQQRAGADLLHISTPLDGQLSNREVIVFSRPLWAPDRRFDGIVLVSVHPSFFTQHYAEPILRDFGMVGVIGDDGVVRATRAGNVVHASRTPFLRAALPASPAVGVARFEGERWFADGHTRVTGWQRMPDYGLVGIVGVDEYSAMAAFRAHRQAALDNAWWNTLWLALAALAATSLYLHARWKQHQIEAIRSTYRLATEDAGEGFFINRPLRDLHGAVRDFEIVDCNQYGADMFGKGPRELIGHRLSEFYQGKLFKAACARLGEALDTGLHDSEIQVTAPNQLLKPKWIRYKAVRAGDDLAVTIRDISEAKAHLSELELRSNSDALTGLPNRHWIQHYLPQAIEAARSGGRGLAVLFIDLDGFKTVNDALGHAAGDELLRTVGKRLKLAVRPRDHVVRLGGDEFVVVLEHVDSPAGVEHVAGRVLEAFHNGFHLQHSTHVLGASIGISLFPEHGDDAQTLLKNADIAMYSVKTDGKGSFRFFQARFFEAIRTRLETELELRSALDLQQFVVHYQPRVDLAAGTASSMEALVRWDRPGKGLVGPDSFIALAEETGLIVQLGEQVVDSVCRQLAHWARDGAVLVPVSVNISPRQFSQCDVPALFRSASLRHGIDPSLLEIEVTESSMMQEGIGESDVFRQLRGLGIKLCIDDFGTGYSSLSQLQKLRFDVLKIDRAFVLRIEHPDGDTLIASMIAMAHALGMRVVAEGVESIRQMQLLKTLGCDEGQGYYFSRPVAPGERQPVAAHAFP
ncbi:bifunctional diguanylate cyclase/phosphodiesterase [Telluria aromaticivorans]|uniref:EAL domain-containing protein n=1 Tax=Telluria aromaticivorans TaxID=2725995 RepID=A0A7Y2JZ39_9BURK|nr:EAL domain-containing protein [Telluria aromaticivorans]NNG22384.1 EAL domain-containing protein [Telluria aromaticivorans]